VDQVHIRRTSIPLGQQIPQTRSVLDAILERVDVDVTINSLAVAGEQADAVAPVKTPAQLVRVTEGFIAVAIDAVIELGSLAPVEPASPYPAGGGFLDTAWKDERWVRWIALFIAGYALNLYSLGGQTLSPTHIDEFTGRPRVIVISDIGNEPAASA
jgi:hypothetical protein